MQPEVGDRFLRTIRLLCAGPVSTLGGESLSVRQGKGRVLISRLGGRYACLETEGLMLVDLEGNVLSGMGEPPYEMELHLGTYKAVDAVSSVFFSQPTLTLSLLEDGLSPHPVGEQASLWLGLFPSLRPAGLLDDDFTDILHVLSYSNLCLFPKKGVVTLGRTPGEALWLCSLIEEASRATLELIRLDSGLHKRLKEAKIEETFFISPFPWPLFGKAHRKFIADKIALHKDDLIGALAGIPPFETVFCLAEVADAPKRSLEVGFTHDGVRLLGVEKRLENAVRIEGGFPVLEALFSGKTTLASAVLHGRLQRSGLSLRQLRPFLRPLEGFLRAVLP